MKCSGLGLLVLLLLASCSTTRAANVCCSSDAECAQLGLPPGSANEYGCSQGFVCQDFYCVTEPAPDAAIDAVVAPNDTPSGRCNPTAPFGVPTRVPNVNSTFEELDMSMTSDELTAFFVRGSSLVLQTSSRASMDTDFPTPTTSTSVAPIGAAHQVLRAFPTFDGLTLYFRDNTFAVYAAQRPSTSGTFTSGSGVFVDGAPLIAGNSKVSVDSLTLYWTVVDDKLRAATRNGTYDNFVNGRVVSLHNMTDFAISADELTLYYSNFPNPDIFVSTRASKNVPFDVGAPVSNVSTSGGDIPLLVTADGCLLYLRSDRLGSTGSNDYWVARRSQ